MQYKSLLIETTAQLDLYYSGCCVPSHCQKYEMCGLLHQFRSSDAIVVGSYFKRGGVWWNEISEERVSALMAAFHNC